jgi:hypothetical protein
VGQNKLSAQSKFSLVFKHNLHAFQPKHLIEHHVYVHLPHLVKFHFENNGFEILEVATIGNIQLKKCKISFHYIKDLIGFLFLKFFVLLKPESKGQTQAFFVVKK